MRAYSLRQMRDLGIYVDDYKTNEKDGIFTARLDYKRWGKNCNVLAYFTFEDGSKIMASAWKNTGYLGIPETNFVAVVKKYIRFHGNKLKSKLLCPGKRKNAVDIVFVRSSKEGLASEKPNKRLCCTHVIYMTVSMNDIFQIRRIKSELVHIVKHEIK